jgi:predicted Rossmann fold nucleotide-binding protein DprA/Smf involved in DNA uptake
VTVRELIERLQREDPKRTVVMLCSGGAVYYDIDAKFVVLPRGGSIAICPLHDAPKGGEQRR